MTRDANSPPGTAVVVLGMARSGTSAFTRLLALLGVDLGPREALLPPIAGENAKGFFEHRPLMRINKELLEHQGGSWSQPPLPAPGWELDRGLDDLRERARSLLAGDFAGAPLWGFKDPRTSLTLPFWDGLLGADVRYVICHRRPLDSARSLEQRNGIRLDEGVALWTRYMASALAHTAGRRRIVVGYEELLSDREALVGELAGFLVVGEGEVGTRVRTEVREWVAEDLRHHASTLRELVEHPAVSAEAQALHLLLERAIAGRHDAESEGLDNALDGMAQALLRHGAARAARDHRPAVQPSEESGIEASIVVVVADDPWGAMACLESIGDLQPGSPRHEVVLVNNASVGLRATIAALEGEVRIVRLPERVQASEAMRAGVAAARGETVVCLPEPGLLAADALSALCAEPAARRHEPMIAGAPHVSPPPAPLCRRGPGVEEIEVSVVVPTLDAASAGVHDCLRALQATIRAPHEIVVLDNGAPPQGFTAPVNAALRAARGSYLVVVNDDVRVLDGWWEPLADALDRGAPLVFPLTVAGRMRWEFAAWCFAMRRELLEGMAAQPGEFFDPSMLVWCRDLDLRRRMAAAGLAPLCVPESRIRHAGSRTVGVAAPHHALRGWIHAQAGRDTEVFRARYPDEARGGRGRDDAGLRADAGVCADAGVRDGPPRALPALTAEHIETALGHEPIVVRAEGPAWQGHTLDWPASAQGGGHFFLVGDIEVRSGDPVQDILLRAIFRGGSGDARAKLEGEGDREGEGGRGLTEEEEELFWIDLVPGVIGTGRRSFSLPRESARAIPRGAGAPGPEWGQVRSVHICARSRLRGALRRAPSADGATVATVSNLRLLAQPAGPAVVVPGAALAEARPAATAPAEVAP